MTNPFFSIITPMYNSFSKMRHYFDSLRNQSFMDFEIIIIDDCSSDGSYEKLKNYIEALPLSISVYQSDENRGPGNARNIGIDVAKGEWITFIDNDDWVDNSFLEKAREVILSNSIDTVIIDYYTASNKKAKRAYSMYSGERGLVSLSECLSLVRNHTFGKLYKRSKCIDNKVRFPNLRRCEDVTFLVRALVACPNVYYLKEPLYYYWQSTSSLSNSKKLDETDMLKAFKLIEDEFGSQYPEEIKEKSIPDVFYGVLLMMCKSRKNRKDIMDYIHDYEAKFPEFYNACIINYLGTAKRLFIKMAKNKLIFAMRLFSLVHSLMIAHM